MVTARDSCETTALAGSGTDDGPPASGRGSVQTSTGLSHTHGGVSGRICTVSGGTPRPRGVSPQECGGSTCGSGNLSRIVTNSSAELG